MSNSRKLLTSCLGSILAMGLTATSLTSAAAADREADPTGTWKWERTFGDNTVQFTLRLEFEGGKVQGSYASPRGETKIEQAKLASDQLSFQVRREFNDRKLTINFRGKVTEDLIKGKGEYSFDGETREFDWEANRAVERADVVGIWEIQFETLYADFIGAKVTISEEGGKLKGAFTDQRGEAEVELVEIRKNELTFDVSGEKNGTRWKQAFRGKPRGSTIKGTYDYDSRGRSGTLTFHGKLTSTKNEKEG